MSFFKKIFVSVAITVLFFSVFEVSTALAANYQLSKFATVSGFDTSGSKSTLEGLSQTIIKGILSALGIVFLAFALYAGIRWMTAQGNEEHVTKAKDTLESAIIGIVIVAISYAITTLVFNLLQNKPSGPSPAETLAKSCTKNSDCASGENCDVTTAKCVSNAPCSDPINQCGGACAVKCNVGSTCTVLSDCISNNCVGGKCVQAVDCSQFKTPETCIQNITCDWTIQEAGGIEGCYVKP
jgi:hypothetical protein